MSYHGTSYVASEHNNQFITSKKYKLFNFGFKLTKI